MNIKHVWFLFLISVLSFLLSSCTMYSKEELDQAYQDGLSDGWDKGYSYGYEEGYEVGNSDGYITGYDDGKEDGYIEGFEDTLRWLEDE